MNILSLFDGISCCRLALDRAGIKYDKYYASEVDKYAIQIAIKNYPDTIQLGDVTKIDFSKLKNIDLIAAGSPCQGFSFAGKQLNFNDARSKLFFEFVRAVKTIKPKYFLLENVKMKKEYQDVISELLGAQPIEINSSRVSAQNRKRLYWANFPITQPEDKHLYLKDIIEGGADMMQILRPRGNNPGGLRAKDGKSIPITTSSFEQNVFLVDRYKLTCLDANYWKGGNLKSYFEKNRRQLVFVKGLEEGRRLNDGKSNSRNFREGYRIYSTAGKAACLTHQSKGGPGGMTGLYGDELSYRKLSPIECERLQTLPDNWTEGISNTQRYKSIGNAWTVDVIAHIFRGIK